MKSIETRYGLSDEQRDRVYRAAGYANSAINMSQEDAIAWIEHFSQRLHALALSGEK